jgi:hypothetical protein
MNWKRKALVQGCLARLPEGLGRSAYAMLQGLGGDGNGANPLPYVSIALRMARAIERQGGRIEGATVIEIGTGKRLCLPLAFALLGAARVNTVDLNPYLKAHLVFRDVEWLREHRDELWSLCGDRANNREFTGRFEAMVGWAQSARLAEHLGRVGISYRAPTDATRLDMPSGSVNYHVSCSVLEHIPAATVVRILAEGARVVGSRGLLVHRVDMSDHFSHSDASISSVNFLRFNERDWQRKAGNRFGFHNRLRIDEFMDLVREAGLEVVAQEQEPDPGAEALLRAGALPLDDRFRDKPPEVNAMRTLWFVARQAGSR